MTGVNIMSPGDLVRLRDLVEHRKLHVPLQRSFALRDATAVLGSFAQHKQGKIGLSVV